MTFKIISVGWKCEEFIDRTLASVAAQTRDDWQIAVIYDGGDNGAEPIRKWCNNYFECAGYFLNEEQKFAVRNQYEGICVLEPADEDIIVFLDLDGDQLAHPNVLQRLADHYADDTLLTYGSYKPIPDPGTCTPATPFPAPVIRENAYRKHIAAGNSCCFNHLRTMKGKIFKAIPPDRFKWPNGEWYTAGTDYLFMVNGLELAGQRHKCINETLLLYNHANPHADYLSHPDVTRACVADILQRPPLSPLE
jgi:glycosyltransferase involved in cell wall biosynthesis